jgi:tRNA A-37 threonylcarbamoyl transferase component Bud32
MATEPESGDTPPRSAPVAREAGAPTEGAAEGASGAASRPSAAGLVNQRGRATEKGVGAPRTRSLEVAPDSSPGTVAAPTKSVATIDLSGLLATSPDAVRRRLLGPWAEGLRQYLALRLGDLDLAAQRFSELKRRVEARRVEDMVQAPGARARIYEMARGLAKQSIGHDATAPAPKVAPLDASALHALALKGLVFRAPLKPKPGYEEALERLRGGLGSADAELLELRWARELSVEEIAFVLHEEVKEVQLALGRAVTRARELLAEHGRRDGAGDTIAVAVVDAFALARGPQVSEGAPRGSEVGLDAGTLIGGRYRVAKQVGAGAFGEVYRAEDQDVPGHVVALKILREPALSQMVREHHLRELKLIAAVFHPSVVHFKDHGWFDDRLWFVMPWYEGDTLEKRMRKVGGIGRAEARRIFEPVARALATLHKSGIRHQDIKPDNIFLARILGAGDDDGTLPVLLDLGVAATEHEALIGGTPVYFAPEVAAHYAMKPDAPEVGPPADVFALALSLRNALEPESEEDVPAGAVEAFIEKRSRTAPPLLTRPDLKYLLPHFARWLSLDGAERPTAEEFARELAVLTAPEEQAERRRRMLAIVLPIVAIAVTVVSALGYVYVREREISHREISAARDDAARARGDAERVSADLVIEEARREAVETDHAALLRQYDEERLTRDQLSQRLATAEGEIRILRERLTTILGERDVALGELATTRTALASTRSELSSVRADLERSSASLAAARAEIATTNLRADGLEDRLAEAERRAAADVAEARARERELEVAVEALQADLEGARQREEEATGRVAEANQARTRAEEARDAAEASRDRAAEDLAEAERTIVTLRRRLEDAESSGGRGATPDPEPPSP